MPNPAITFFAPPPGKLPMVRRVHSWLPVISFFDLYATSFPMSEARNLSCRLVMTTMSQNFSATHNCKTIKC